MTGARIAQKPSALACAAAALAAFAAAGIAGAAPAQTPIPPKAVAFAMMAAGSDAYEIEAGYTAAVQASDPRVKAFARQMIDDHTRTSQALRAAATTAGLPPPPDGLDSDHARLLSALQSLTGPDFDQTYMKQQVLAHDEALAVQQSYAAAGDTPALRRAAQSAVPLIQHHLQMAEQLRAQVGGGG